MNGASSEWAFYDEVDEWTRETSLMDEVYAEHFRKMTTLVQNAPICVLVSQNGEMAAILVEGNRLVMIERNDENFNNMTQEQLREHIAWRTRTKGIEWP